LLEGIVALTAAVAISAAPAVPAPLVLGLDHIPIAVRNLETASADYRALGFALKPGRPHANGIRNQHAKFADGTELELITAPEARDPLTTFYRRHLDQGEGPGFVAFYAPETDSIVEQLEDTHKPYRSGVGLVTFPDEDSLRYIFFGRRNASTTDRPQHFAHPNGAESLIGVWLAGDDFSAERRLWDKLRLTVSEEEVRAPDSIRVPVVHLPAGEILLLPGDRQVVPGRKVVGATIRVRRLAATRRTLSRGRVKVPPTVETKIGSSIFLPPTVTHGIWLEFREQR